ncbi:MAG: DUF1512 domain-containing protein [Desulfurococcaceae archaeon]
MNGDFSSTVSLVIQIIWIILFLLLITGLNQKIQLKLWILDIRMKLNTIQSILEEDKNKVRNILRNLGVDVPEAVLSRVLEFFTIEPVEIEPTDIIKRMDHLLRTTETSVRRIIEASIPNLGRYERSLIESSMSIIAALNIVYKVIRHYLITGERENNFILIMQLVYSMPQLMKIVQTYHEALESFTQGRPIGDGAGPLVVYNILEKSHVKSRRVVDDTSVIEAYYKDRRIILIKAEGPGSNVGHPGAVLSKVIEELKGGVDLVITIDAALKLEGEETGSIAEGVGAAIGDPGPEKIAIERATSKYNIPLRALVIKMDLKEAITTMKKEIYEACERTLLHIEKILEENTSPNSTVIIAGIGNTMGIPG